MMKKLSWKALQRSPVKTGLLCLLLTLITAFSCLGISMFDNSSSLLKQADKTYTTVGIVEYTAGDYPDETSFSKETVKKLRAFDQKTLVEQKQVKEFSKSDTLMAYVDGIALSDYFKPHFNKYAIVEFKVMYATEDGGYRCVLTKTHYAKEDKTGATFGISSEAASVIGEFTLEPEHTYIASGDLRREENLLTFGPSMVSGICDEDTITTYIKDYPMVDITNNPNYFDSEEGKYWKKIAEFYRVENGSFQVTAMDELETSRDFYLGSLELLEGRTWTEKEKTSGAKVCLLDKGTASFLEKKIGDNVELNFHCSEDPVKFAESYNPDEGFLETGTYKVIGIYDNLKTRGSNTIYLPKKSLTHLPKNQVHYNVGTLILENGEGEAYLKAVDGILKEHFRVTVYDQGYEKTVEPIYAMRTNAILILILCGICSVAVLALFASIFIWKQQETVAVMTALGTGKKRIQNYLMSGAGMVALIGCILGGVLGFFSSKAVINFAYTISKRSYIRDLRYSSVNMGLQKEFQGEITTSPLYTLLIVALVFISAMILCYCMSEKIIRVTANFGGQIPKKKKHNKKEKVVSAAAVPKEKFQYETAGLNLEFKGYRKLLFMSKQSFRALKRNLHSGALLLMVAVVLSIFMICYTAGIEYYEKSLVKTYDEQKVDAYFTTVWGEPLAAWQVPEKALSAIEESKNCKASYWNMEAKYEYIGKIQAEKGTKDYKKQQKEMYQKAQKVLTIPQNAFALETRMERIARDNSLVQTENLTKTKEFFQIIQPKITYLEGYEKVLSKGEQFKKEKEMPVLLTTTMMKKENLSLGDIIVIGNIITEYDRTSYVAQPVTCKVVASYQSDVGEDTIYCSLANDLGIDDVVDRDFRLMINGVPWGGNKTYYPEAAFANYELRNVDRLKKLKDNMQVNGISSVGIDGKARVSLIIDDKELMQTVENIENNIDFMKTLRYVLFVFVILIGFVVSFMVTRTRRAEFAIMRSMGTGTTRTFFIFFIEQLMVAICGTLMGTLLCLVYFGTLTQAEVLSVLLFFGMFVAGSIIAIVKMNRKNVLSILGAKE
ncbi:MAG: FtsX-like permease family protein [Lachnospiraceae bacterium]